MTTHIYELLIAKGHKVRSSGQDYLIHCLNPEHEDRNPSLRIDMNTGKFRCPSCGFSGNILKYYNILTTSVSVKVSNLMSSISKIKASLSEVSFLPGSVLYKNSFKGVSSKTLQKFEAFYTTEVSGMEDRLIFPIKNVLGKVQAFIGRHIHSDSGAKYKIYPKGAPLGCYPIIIDKSSQYIILVEGIFDMLNLYDKGAVNAVCSFGVDFLINDTATKILPYKAQGITTIFIMYDGDNAGRTAAKKLQKVLQECLFNVEIINLPDNKDPGILTEEEVIYYMELINEKSSHYR